MKFGGEPQPEEAQGDGERAHSTCAGAALKNLYEVQLGVNGATPSRYPRCVGQRRVLPCGDFTQGARVRIRCVVEDDRAKNVERQHRVQGDADSCRTRRARYQVDLPRGSGNA